MAAFQPIIFNLGDELYGINSRIVFLGELSENDASHVKSVTLENVYEP